MLTVSGKKKPQGRAGIAVGNTPPILTIDPGSVAFKSGLVTGNQIVAIDAGERTIAIENMARFWAELTYALDENRSSITLHVRDEDVSGNGEDVPPITGMERIVKVELAASVDAGQLSVTQKGEMIGSALGIHGSQLTVKTAEAPVLGVLMDGDRLVSWNGVKIADIYHLSDLLRDGQVPTVDIEIIREGKLKSTSVPLLAHEIQKPEGLGVAYDLPVKFYANLIEPQQIFEKYDRGIDALQFGFRHTFVQARSMLDGIWGLITGDVPVQSLGGPILIAKVAGDSAKLGFVPFLVTLALISINLGLVNLLPIPVLDGGQLVLLATEGIRRRPLSESAIENFQKIGFVMVLSLVVLAMFNDLSRFWSSMVKGITGIVQ